MKLIKKITVFVFLCVMHRAAYAMNGISKPTESLFVNQELAQAIAMAKKINELIDQNDVDAFEKLLHGFPDDSAGLCFDDPCNHTAHKSKELDKFLVDWVDMDRRKSDTLYFHSATNIPHVRIIEGNKVPFAQLFLKYGTRRDRKFLHPDHGYITLTGLAKISKHPSMMRVFISPESEKEDSTFITRGKHFGRTPSMVQHDFLMEHVQNHVAFGKPLDSAVIPVLQRLHSGNSKPLNQQNQLEPKKDTDKKDANEKE